MNRVLHGAIILAAALLPAPSAFADDYPARTIRMVAPAPPGGSSDIYARLVAAKISPMLPDCEWCGLLQGDHEARRHQAATLGDSNKEAK